MDGHTGRRGGGEEKGSARGSGSGHTSQEVTPAMPDYKQCALSTSAVLAVEHTTSATAKGVGACREEGKTVSAPLPSLSL